MTARSGLRPPAETGSIRRQPLVEVSGVVDPTVVEAAERDHVGQVGPTAMLQGRRWWSSHQAYGTSQPVGGAAGVSGGAGDALGLGEEPLGCVRGRAAGTAPPSTAGTSPALAGQPAGLGGGDQVAGVEAGGAELTAEGVEVEGDHDGGGDLAVEPVGRQVLEELGERLAAVVGPVAVTASGLGARAPSRRGEARSSRRGPCGGSTPRASAP